MKLGDSFNLEDSIRDALTEKCSARCLDDEGDFEAVMKVIGDLVGEWLEGRCEGCK